MVAITVILAAVIAAFVFGMAGNISKTKVVAATVQQPDADTITITYQGGQDSGTLHNLSVTINDVVQPGSGVTLSPPNGLGIGLDDGSILAVGSSASFTNPGAYAGRDHIVVTGYFTDSTQQVILDNFV
jgi:FlaG/FlaF family flagellin (archaellin)